MTVGAKKSIIKRNFSLAYLCTLLLGVLNSAAIIFYANKIFFD